MNAITLYTLKLHNSNHYRLLSQAAAAFSAVIARRLEGMSEEDLRHAEILYSTALEEQKPVRPVDFHAFTFDGDCEPHEYIHSIIDAVIEAETYQERIYKDRGMDGLYNIAFYRVNDFRLFKKYIEDGSLFGSAERVIDFQCTSCGYIHRIANDGDKYMPQDCPCCDAERSAFIRRPEIGGW